MIRSNNMLYLVYIRITLGLSFTLPVIHGTENMLGFDGMPI